MNLQMRVYAIIRRYYDIYGKRNKAIRVLGSRYSLETLLRRLKSLTGRTYITTKYYFVPFISFPSIVKSLNFHWNKFETPRLSFPLLFCSPIFNLSPKLHSMVIQTLMPRRCDSRYDISPSNTKILSKFLISLRTVSCGVLRPSIIFGVAITRYIERSLSHAQEPATGGRAFNTQKHLTEIAGPPSLQDSATDRQTERRWKGMERSGRRGGSRGCSRADEGTEDSLRRPQLKRSLDREFSCQPVMEFLCFPEQWYATSRYELRII